MKPSREIRNAVLGLYQDLSTGSFDVFPDSEDALMVRFAGPRELDLKGFDGPQPVLEVVWR